MNQKHEKRVFRLLELFLVLEFSKNIFFYFFSICGFQGVRKVLAKRKIPAFLSENLSERTWTIWGPPSKAVGRGAPSYEGRIASRSVESPDSGETSLGLGSPESQSTASKKSLFVNLWKLLLTFHYDFFFNKRRGHEK